MQHVKGDQKTKPLFMQTKLKSPKEELRNSLHS